MKLQEAIFKMEVGDEFEFKSGSASTMSITKSGNLDFRWGTKGHEFVIADLLEFGDCIGEITAKKDEPMSAGEWVTTARFPSPPPNQYPAYLRVLKNVFEAGAAENEKKHRATQTFDEWWAEIGGMPYRNEQFAKETWQACKKAHNLPEEN